MFIEPPGLQHTRSGRIVQAPDRWVVPMFRQEGDSQEEDGRWYQKDPTWEAEMVLTQGAETVDPQQQKQLPSKQRKRTVERRDGSAWWVMSESSVPIDINVDWQLQQHL